MYAGRLDLAKECATEALRIRRELGNLTDIGNTLQALGHIAHDEGRLDEVERYLREGIAAMRESGDQGDLALALPRLCGFLVICGRFAEAEAVAREDAALLEEMGSRPRLASILSRLGNILMHLGRYGEARDYAERALKLAEDSAPSSMAIEPRGLALGRLAFLALREGRYAEAERLFREVEAITHQIAPEDQGSYLDGSGYAALRQGRLSDAARYFRDLLGRAVAEHLFFPCLFALPGIALWRAERGEKERAVELYALACRYAYVADSRWFEQVAGRDLQAVAAALPSEIGQGAEERGRGRDFWGTVKELLAELEQQKQD